MKTSKTFKFVFVAPMQEHFEFNALLVTVPGESGYLGVMANHWPIITKLKTGLVHIVDSNQEDHWYAITGGFFEMMGDHATLLADEIVTPQEAETHTPQRLKTGRLFFPQEFSSDSQKSELAHALLWRKLYGE